MSNKSKSDEGTAPVTGTSATDTGTSATTAADAETYAKKIISEAEAKAAAIVAEAAARAEARVAERVAAAAGTTTPTVSVKDDPMEELVAYEAPLLPGVTNARSIFVSVNGENVQIQRGVPVTIKRKFVEALNNASRQEFAAFEANLQLKKQIEKPLASM